VKTGYLSDYFKSVAVKRLSAVEVDTSVSNQHEFNGVQDLKQLFGKERQTLPARYVYLGKDEDHYSVVSGFVTWYDARERHPVRSEYRLYFPANTVTQSAAEGDLLVISRRNDDEVIVIVAQAKTTYENQILWLFGISSVTSSFQAGQVTGTDNRELEYAARLILELLEIEVEIADIDWLDRILEKYGEEFPSTKEFSGFARETCTDTDSVSQPDQVLTHWLEHEEMLFRTLEKHIVEKKLKDGFECVDEFIRYSLHIQNRRKSRAGHALENHLESIFRTNRIRYSRGAVTENKSRPDFLFPGISFYNDDSFPAGKLTMLGVKSTCKDRWRQVLSEARRIQSKNLLTLEPGISIAQTDEMKFHSLQLVVPIRLHGTFDQEQQKWLWSLKHFIDEVKTRQHDLPLMSIEHDQ
jgi:hypothetical protein